MKKLLALTLAALFLSVGIAGATDFTLTGSYFARGTWKDNITGMQNDSIDGKKNQYGDYDHELSLDANWKISDATRVFARFEMRDDTWAVASNPYEGATPGVTPGGETYDDNIILERVWGSHNFGQGTTVRTGLVGTSSWFSDFGNNGTEAYRVQVNHMTPIGLAIFFTEKPAEIGAETKEEDADRDDYVAALVTKVGNVTLYPLLKYVDYEQANLEVYALDFGAEGSFNNLAWKAEFVYSDYDYEVNAADYSVYGAFVELAAQLNAFKLTGFIAYSSYDDDVHKAYSMGDDFTANGAIILGDDLFMFNETTADALQAATLLGIKGSWAMNEKLTLSAYFAYADSNVDNPADKWDGGSAWEVNVQGEYKITDNVTYSVGLAQAQAEFGDATPDPDEAIEAFHMLSFSF